MQAPPLFCRRGRVGSHASDPGWSNSQKQHATPWQQRLLSRHKQKPCIGVIPPHRRPGKSHTISTSRPLSPRQDNKSAKNQAFSSENQPGDSATEHQEGSGLFSVLRESTKDLVAFSSLPPTHLHCTPALLGYNVNGTHFGGKRQEKMPFFSHPGATIASKASNSEARILHGRARFGATYAWCLMAGLLGICWATAGYIAVVAGFGTGSY